MISIYSHNCMYRLSTGNKAKNDNPWLDGCLFHLMRLTLMAVGGYASEMQRRNGCLNGESVFATPPRTAPVPCATAISDISNPESDVKFMKFPLPIADSGVMFSSTVASPGCGVAEKSTDTGTKDAQPSASVVTVVCVDFHHIEDVVRLWLDNVKIFSDFASSEPVEVSKNATFCLKV